MIVEFNVILDIMCMLVAGRERQCGKDASRSSGTACAKAWKRKGHSVSSGMLEAQRGWK